MRKRILSKKIDKLIASPLSLKSDNKTKERDDKRQYHSFKDMMHSKSECCSCKTSTSCANAANSLKRIIFAAY